MNLVATEGGWRINCLSISQRIRDRNLVVKVDDKLKLGVSENVAPNTKRMILGCTEFECSRVSKATAGSVYPWNWKFPITQK